jgi:hypothetical protein
MGILRAQYLHRHTEGAVCRWRSTEQHQGASTAKARPRQAPSSMYRGRIYHGMAWPTGPGGAAQQQVLTAAHSLLPRWCVDEWAAQLDERAARTATQPSPATREEGRRGGREGGRHSGHSSATQPSPATYPAEPAAARGAPQHVLWSTCYVLGAAALARRRCMDAKTYGLMDSYGLIDAWSYRLIWSHRCMVLWTQQTSFRWRRSTSLRPFHPRDPAEARYLGPHLLDT